MTLVARYIEAQLRERIARVLSVMNEAEAVEELALPGYRLHELKGDMKGNWSITVDGNWRITFRLRGSAFIDVDLTNYHE